MTTLTEAELAVAVSAYWDAPGHTTEGIRAAVEAVLAMRAGEVAHVR